MKKISIILISKESNQNLIKNIKKWLNQDYKKKEIVVVVPNTKYKNANVKIVKDPKKGPSVARNIGYKQSSGEVIMFKDVDEIGAPTIKNNFVSTIMEKFNQKEIDYIFVSYLPKISNNILESAVNIKDFGCRTKATSHLPSAYSRRVLNNPPFDPKLEYGEDKALYNYVRKKSNLYDKIEEPLILSSNITTLKRFVQRYGWYGSTIEKYLKKNKDYRIILTLLLPIVFLLSLLFKSTRGIAFLILLWLYIKQKEVMTYCLKNKGITAFIITPFITLLSYFIELVYFLKSKFKKNI